MANLLVDVPDWVLEALQTRAARKGRAVEEEHLAILEDALRGDHPFWEKARKLREQTRGRVLGDSTLLIRADRDSR
ncbi:MAG: FitA-like ribbon-helix-helix domain-containing protein [Ignavibacteriales bacterium]